MKKLLLLSIALITFSGAFAQTEQGKIIVGASSDLSFASTKVEDADDSTVSFNIAPQVGYFVIDNLALGALISFESEKLGDEKDSFFAAGPFARYYFLDGNIKPFAEAAFLFGSTKFEGEGFDTKINTTALSISAGAAFFLNDYISIDAALGYIGASAKGDEDGAEKVNATGFGLDVGFSLYF